MVELELVLSILQTVSIIVGVFYYIMTLQNSNKTQQLTLKAQEHATETRHAQLYMTLFNTINNEEIWKHIAEIREYSFIDFDDFLEKYGSVNNPDAYAKLTKVWWFFTQIGTLVYRGFITTEDVNHLIAIQPILVWEKWGPIIVGFREKVWESKTGYSTFEYLAKTMMKEIVDLSHKSSLDDLRIKIPDIEVSDVRKLLKEHLEIQT